MFRLLLIPVLLLLVSCGPIPRVDQRMKYWAGEAESFFGDDRKMQEVHSWLRSHNVIYTFDDGDIIDGSWTMTLEKVYIENWQCEWIDIQLVVSVDDAQTIQSYELTQYRACMW